MNPYHQDESVTVYHGDCIDVLKTLPDNSIDSIMTDPPYNLSYSGKRDTDCLSRILANVALPYHDQRNSEVTECSDFAPPTFIGSELSREGGAVGIDARVRMPEGAIDFDCRTTIKHEINARNISATDTTNRNLTSIPNSAAIELGGNYVLKPTDGRDESFCDTTCCCFTEPSAGVIAVTVALPCSATSNLSGNRVGAARRSDTHIRTDDNTTTQAEAAPIVMTSTRTELAAVLRLDLSRRSGELRIADGASEHRPIFQLEPAQPIGAGAGTSRFSTPLEPTRISIVNSSTNGTFTLNWPWHQFNNSRSTGGFMNKAWDGWASPASFQRWCAAWATECLRVLKPGGHMLAFGGTRTYHWLACAVEDAGFEIRDSIGYGHIGGDANESRPTMLAWIYGSGFP